MNQPARSLFRLLRLALLLAGSAGILDAANVASPGKKVIYHGWDTRDSASVAAHWEEMEQMPFDGIGIGVALNRGRPTIGDGSTGNLPGWQVFGPVEFKSETFREGIADLRKPAWKRFTDNFLPVAIATRDQDAGLSWFDDARWLTRRWHTQNPDRNHFTPAGFERALRGALHASDRYVWIYSEENPRFFPPENLSAGYLRAIRAARQPSAATAAMPLSWAGLASTATLCALIGGKGLRRRGSSGLGAMRILMVTGIFPPDRGGPASYVPKMARALAGLGHKVEVVCLSDHLANDDSVHSFHVHRIRRGQFWPLRIAKTVLTIWRAARRHDLVFVNGLGSESALAALLAGRPAVHKIVGDYAWERAVGRKWFPGTIDEYQTSPKSPVLKALDFVRTVPLKLARQIIVPSHYLSRIVGGWRLRPEKIRVIHNAVGTPAIAKPANLLPPWEGRTLITVCRLVPWKGVAELIRILPGLPETRLVIAGDGHLRAELAALAESCLVAKRILFLGDVPHSEIADCLAQSDAFVLNSTYEGLPHVVLEAMAAGIPVIATDAGGTGEVVRHEITGLLVPVGDNGALQSTIDRLWRDASLCTRLAAGASDQLRKDFDFDVMVGATEATLRAVLGSPSEPQPVAVGETP